MSTASLARRNQVGDARQLLITFGTILVAAAIFVGWQGISWYRQIGALDAQSTTQENNNKVQEKDLQAFEVAAPAIGITHTRLVDSCTEPVSTAALPPAVPGAPSRPAPPADAPVQMGFLSQNGLKLSPLPPTGDDRARAVSVGGEMEFHRLVPILAAAETNLPLLVTDKLRLEAGPGAPLFSTQPMRLRLQATMRLPIRAAAVAAAKPR